MKITTYDGIILDFPTLTPKQKKFLIQYGLKALATDVFLATLDQEAMACSPNFDLHQAMLTRINKA